MVTMFIVPADNQCVAMLAEQIMEAISDDCAAVRDAETPQPGESVWSLRLQNCCLLYL